MAQLVGKLPRADCFALRALLQIICVQDGVARHRGGRVLAWHVWRPREIRIAVRLGPGRQKVCCLSEQDAGATTRQRCKMLCAVSLVRQTVLSHALCSVLELFAMVSVLQAQREQGLRRSPHDTAAVSTTARISLANSGLHVL